MTSQIHLLYLIDDDETFNFLNSRILEKSAFVQKVKTFEAANLALIELSRVANFEPDQFPEVILLDINMPVMNGWEFLEELQKFPETVQKKCEVFILSSSIDPYDIEEAKKYTMVHDFISKPLTVEKTSIPHRYLNY